MAHFISQTVEGGKQKGGRGEYAATWFVIICSCCCCCCCCCNWTCTLHCGHFRCGRIFLCNCKWPTLQAAHVERKMGEEDTQLHLVACMPLWYVRQLKRKQFESLLQITQQHLATCRKSCGKLQLQLSAPLCAIIIFKSFSEYSCNTHTHTQTEWQPQLHLPRAVCLENHKLSREILAVHATNGATKSEKKNHEEEKRKNGI